MVLTMEYPTVIEKVSLSGFAVAHVEGKRFRIRQKPDGPALVAGDEIALLCLGTMGGFIAPGDWRWCAPERRATEEAKRKKAFDKQQLREKETAQLQEKLPFPARIDGYTSKHRGTLSHPEYGKLIFRLRDCDFVPAEGDDVIVHEIRGYLDVDEHPSILRMECPAKPAWTYFDGGWFGEDFAQWALASEQSDAWSAVVQLARDCAERSKPTKKWLREREALLAVIGKPAFAARLTTLLPEAPLTAPKGTMPPLTEEERDLLKGLMWMSQGLAGEELAAAIAQLAERSFKKVAEYGEIATRVGNAGINTLASLQDGVGISHLSRLLGKVRTTSARKTINRALGVAAEAAGQTREDLEELAVPDFGISIDSAAHQPIGEFTAELAIEDGKAVLRWLKADGKPQKSVPKAVKEGFAEELRSIKRQHKELKEQLATQSRRLEHLWILDRRMPVAQLMERYLMHPVVACTARKLLWLVETKGEPLVVLWRDGALAGLGGQQVELADTDEVRLLHLLDLDEDTIAVWRDDLDELGLVQPFAQLWREVYRPTTGRRVELVAGHIIHQQAFRSQCQRREWRYALQGRWDGDEDDARRSLGDLEVSFEVEAVDYDRDYEYAATYLVTGAVTFHAKGSPGEPLLVADVPPLIYSEVMRDVDMFVSHCTISNDASFNAAEVGEVYSDYWVNNNWADLRGIHCTRAEVLRRTLPRTILRDSARVEEPALRVEGPAGAFLIHIGTTQVRREGQEGFVNVPIDKGATKNVLRVFLPFEGDHMMAEALAKAFYLSECTSLDDPTV